MTVKEMVDILNTFPCDTEVAVIYPDDIYGDNVSKKFIGRQ